MDPNDIERVLWEQWQPIFCPSPEEESPPNLDVLRDRFGQYVVHAPVVLPGFNWRLLAGGSLSNVQPFCRWWLDGC